MDEVLLERIEDGVLTLTMNRPDRLNALSWEMCDRLVRALERAAADRAVGAILLTGAGRAFCAGGDVKSMAEGRRRARDLRGADRRFAPPHGSLAPAARDREADRRHDPRPRRGGRSVAGARVRPAHRRRGRAAYHRLRQSRALGRFRRALFPDPPRRHGEGARALFPVAGHRRQDGAGARPRPQGRQRCRARGRGEDRSRAPSPRGRAWRSPI